MSEALPLISTRSPTVDDESLPSTTRTSSLKLVGGIALFAFALAAVLVELGAYLVPGERDGARERQRRVHLELERRQFEDGHHLLQGLMGDLACCTRRRRSEQMAPGRIALPLYRACSSTRAGTSTVF